MADPLTAGLAAGAAAIQGVGNLAGKNAASNRNAELDKRSDPIEQALPGLANMMMSNPAMLHLTNLAGLAMNNPALAMTMQGIEGLQNNPYADRYTGSVDEQLARLRELYGQSTDPSMLESAADRALFKAGQALRDQYGGSSLFGAGMGAAASDIYSNLARDIAASRQQDRAFRAGLAGQMGEMNRSLFGDLSQDALARRGMYLQGAGQYGNLYNSGVSNAGSLYGQAGNLYQSGLQGAANLYGNLLQYYGGQRPNFQPNWNFSGLATVAAGIK
jgi:hypothetical protein